MMYWSLAVVYILFAFYPWFLLPYKESNKSAHEFLITLLAPNAEAKWRKRGFSRAKREGSKCFGASPPVSPPFPHSFLTKTVHLNLQFSPRLIPGFYLGFIVWGGSPKWPKTTSFPGGYVPRKFFWNDCTAEMQSGAFWDTILRKITVCALTSSCLDDFPI